MSKSYLLFELCMLRRMYVAFLMLSSLLMTNDKQYTGMPSDGK